MVQTTTTQDQVKTTSFVEIDSSFCNDPYNLPENAKIVHAVSTQFSEDRSKRLISRGHGVWHIQTENIELYKNAEFLEYGGQNVAKLSVKSENYVVNSEGRIIKSTSSDDRSDELLVTLYQADTEWFREVQAQDIYKKIVAMGVGHVKRGLTQQMLPGSDVPNGNLFFILKGVGKDDLARIPHSFEFPSKRFGNLRMWVNFKGKIRKCFFCSNFHEGGECPTKTQIRAMETERDALLAKNGNKFQIKMYGDSTLRHVSQKALCGDVDAMSGGTTGNVLNAIDIDQNGDVPHIVIAAGQNELSPRHTREHFAWMQKCKNDRLLSLAQNKTVTILAPPSQSFVEAEGKIRERLFRENLIQLSEKSKNITILDNPIDTYEMDGGKHPSREQTTVVVEYLHQRLGESGIDLLLNSSSRDLMTTERYYRNVRSLYKFGCAACAGRLQNRWPLLCDKCEASAASDQEIAKSVQKIDKFVKELDKEMNPPLTEEKDKVPFRDPYNPPSTQTRERSPMSSKKEGKSAVADNKRSRRTTVLHDK